MIEVELDPRTALELNGDKILYTLEQCEVCAKLYDPNLGHECEALLPKTRDEVIKGLLSCMCYGCSGKCPYFARHDKRLLNGRFASYPCKECLVEDMKRIFQTEVEEVQDGHEDKNTSTHT